MLVHSMPRTLVLVLYLQSLLSAQDAGAPSALDAKERASRALEWSVEVANEFATTLDALPMVATLKNVGMRALEIQSRADAVACIELRLTPEGGEARSAKLGALEGIGYSSHDDHPEPGNLALSFSTELRQIFGRFTAGKYTLQVIYPGSAYSLDDAPGVDLVSSTLAFAVLEATLAEAERAMPEGQAEVRLIPDPPLALDPANPDVVSVQTLRLVNDSKQSLHFYAFVSGLKDDAPLSAILTIDRWNPQTNWKPAGPLGWCGTGMGTVTLDAGESLVLIMNIPLADGISRFHLDYWLKDPNQTRAALSRPFVIDSFKPALKK